MSEPINSISPRLTIKQRIGEIFSKEVIRFTNSGKAYEVSLELFTDHLTLKGMKEDTQIPIYAVYDWKGENERNLIRAKISDGNNKWEGYVDKEEGKLYKLSSDRIPNNGGFIAEEVDKIVDGKIYYELKAYDFWGMIPEGELNEALGYIEKEVAKMAKYREEKTKESPQITIGEREENSEKPGLAEKIAGDIQNRNRELERVVNTIE